MKGLLGAHRGLSAYRQLWITKAQSTTYVRPLCRTTAPRYTERQTAHNGIAATSAYVRRPQETGTPLSQYATAMEGKEGLGKDAGWVGDMPTRAIGKVLLDAPKETMDREKLYEALERMGVVKSYRQYKESLKMMLKMKRVQIFCLGPVRIGSRERKFNVLLTVRGKRAYEWYREQMGKGGGEGGGADERGLKDAL